METSQLDVQESIVSKHDNNHKSKTVVSCIVALYNSENYIDELIDQLESSLVNFSYEIIFVDDGSTDNTANKVQTRIPSNKNFKLIKMRSTFGESAALDAGLKQSIGQNILYFTSRVRINILQLENLLNQLDNGYDLVMGWRYPRGDSKLNRIVSKLFNYIINKITQLNLHDINSGVLAVKKQVLENIEFYGGFSNFIPVLALKQGYKITEEKIEQLPGAFRTSRYVSEYIRRFLDIITVIFLTKYSKKPIHFLGFLGAIFTILGISINFYLFIYRIFLSSPIAGRPLLLLGALFLIIGIQMVSIGLIGEMIIFTHAKEIKEYNIEEIVSR